MNDAYKDGYTVQNTLGVDSCGPNEPYIRWRFGHHLTKTMEWSMLTSMPLPLL